MATGAAVLDLRDPAALDAGLSGAKAANIARAAVAGLKTVPGFVLTTEGVRRRDEPDVAQALDRAWRDLGGAAGVPLVVRSSSTLEDAEQSSMAGQFTSVLDVQGAEAFRDAVERVIASADAVRAGAGPAQPMAVLVQRQIDARCGGVLFSVDPVTGDRRHVMVEVVGSRPDTLVGGSVTAAHYVLSRRGRVLERQRSEAAPALSRRVRRELVKLARRAEAAFGSPQDIEWALGADGSMWLLQSRPITAVGERARGGHVMGTGPVAETFPDPLRPLEADLFVVPLRDGIARALTITGAVSRRQLEASPVLTTIGGWVAADLDVLGVRRSFVRKRLDPMMLGRRLVLAWRVGRMRVALPAMATSLLAAVDHDLSAIGVLGSRSPEELLDLLDRAERELTSVHTYEVLAGMLLSAGRGTVPAGVVALDALQRGRAAGLSDDEIVARHPVVLSLVPPTIGGRVTLPAGELVAGWQTTSAASDVDVDRIDLRDALRLRARWLQELVVRIVRMLASRLAADGYLPDPHLVTELRRDELETLVHTGRAPDDLAARVATPAGPPLPAMFRFHASGAIRPVGPQSGTEGSRGIAAGGGRGAGTVVHEITGPPDDANAVGIVLVTRHLEPQLAPFLPRLAGLVSETGSALSHLAIL
ncbi:MAG TPA: PEP/pyruvate-binding domain-containing protein, partial [Acidimicrobiales bacterium]